MGSEEVELYISTSFLFSGTRKRETTDVYAVFECGVGTCIRFHREINQSRVEGWKPLDRHRR